jgi:hypothetical protein
MAANMGLIESVSLMHRVTDRFHVQKIALEGFTKSGLNTAGKAIDQKMKL